jgi:YYY domain-containing protein
MQARSPRFRLLVLALVVVALGVRLYRVNWDDGHFFHPDERRIAEAVNQLSLSRLQLNPHFFAYGSFPFYVTRVVVSALGVVSPSLDSYDGIIAVGRVLSALWGAATVLVLILLARRLYGEREGLLAGGLLAIAVLHLQNSHFTTNDIPLTFLVTAALALLVKAVEDGRTRDLLAAAALVGLATATKVSALPLLLPVALVVVWRARDQRRLGPFFGLGGAAAAVAAVAFFVGEPYAVLDAHDFLHDIIEQSTMVRHAGIVPYTNQYLGTPDVIYELREIVLWGMGPALGLAAIIGAIVAVRRAWRSHGRCEWLLLSWFVPFFAITVSFQVKFPRYLLPTYPLFALWAAVWLTDLARRSRLGRWARAAVVGVTAAYALAFMAIYTRPHTEVAASKWFYEHVQPGSKVLSQDWDEGFPLPLPARPPEAYRIVNFGYYEPDSPAKMAKLAKELASSDVLVLQTKRIYGAVTQAASKFPFTARYFRFLFAGDLGYTLERDFTSRPSLLGVQLPDELADESFSVYDHPKVLIFRNTGHFSEAKLERTLLAGVPSRMLTRSDLLVADAAHPVESSGAALSGLVRSSPLAFLLVAALLEAVGLAAFALLRLAGWRRGGLYPLAKVLGVLFFAYPVWLIVSLGGLGFNRGTVVVWLLALLAAGAWAWRRLAPDRLPRRELLFGEAAFWGAFLLFLGFRLLNPEVFWGEKPMDFAFLNVLYRTTHLPPPEPWFAGAPLSYTYFGHFTVAAIGKATAVHPALMFNLGIAAVAGMIAAALLAAGRLLTGRWRGGVIAVVVTLVLGNLSVLRELPARRAINFDTFWATSRVIPNTINEYPFWSLTFADLHAHVLALPWALAFVVVLLVWLRRRHAAATRSGHMWTLSVLAVAGLSLGAVSVTNGWSTPTYAALLAGMLCLDWMINGERAHRLGAEPRWMRRLVLEVVVPTALVAALAWLAFRPFWLHFAPPPRNWGWEVGPYAHPVDFFLIFGFPLAVVVPCLFLSWRRMLAPAGQALPAKRRLVLLAAAAVLFVSLLDLSALLHLKLNQAHSIGVFVLLLGVVAVGLAARGGVATGLRRAVALVGLAFLVLAGCEVVFVWDRMNTVFKYYLDSWILLGLASSFMLCHGWRFGGQPARAGRIWRSVVLALGGVAVATTVTAAVGALTGRHVQGPRFTLDGMAYLKSFDPAELEAYRWLNSAIAGTPVLCEAYGPAYQQYSRVSMNTGLPIVLGWDYHVFQRGQSRGAIELRKLAVREIYTSEDRETVERVLRRYRVALVFVGALERTTYGTGIARRFAAWPDLLQPVFSDRGVTIYAVAGAFQAQERPTAASEAPSAEALPAGTPEATYTQDPLGVLRQPRGLAVTADGDAYVADFGNDRIQRFDAGLKATLTWGTKGSASGEFRDPCDVALGPDGRIYVADTWNSRVQVFDTTGAYVLSWGANFYAPRGIAVSPDGHVFVADTGNNRVVRFTAAGVKELEWGRTQGPAALHNPVGVAIDRAGHVLVCDVGAGRLAVFDGDGHLQRSFPVEGWRRQAFSEPFVAVTGEGEVWLSVPLEHQVRLYASDGRLLGSLPIRQADGASLATPIGVALRPSDGALLVTTLEGKLLALQPNPTGVKSRAGRRPSR